MLRKLPILIVFLFISITAFSQTEEQKEELRMLVTLLDYISKDYAVAVQDGEIIDEDEYLEMTDFAEKCAQIQKDLIPVLQIQSFTHLESSLNRLQLAIANKKEVLEISNIAISSKNAILDLGILKIQPNRWPSLSNGAILYQSLCSSCHGKEGGGDGVLAADLDPEPSDFLDDEDMEQLSPLHSYNVIKLGLEGTGMRAFTELSEEEIWDLAFYILTLRHDSPKTDQKPTINISLDSISKWTDAELRNYIEANNLDFTVEDVRYHEPSRPNPLDVSTNELNQSFEAFKQGKIKLAEKHALTSYLEGIELVENILNATNSDLVRSIERNMITYRKAIQNNDAATVEEYYGILSKEIQEAKTILAEKDYSFAFIYGASLSILIREALEALLIILIILSILKPLKIRKAIIAVHAGWITAVIAGFIGWIFIDRLVNLSGASRELMEGIGSIIAVIVLLWAGTWLHSHSEVSKWTGFVKNKIDKISESGNWIGLSLFSFLVVFREAFEVVLFLSSLKLNNPEVAGSAINWALLSTAIIIAIIAFIFLRFTKKLPITQIFKFSAYVIALLAIILTGRGVRALQEAGYIPTTPWDFIPQIDLLGIYPYAQSIIAQIIVLIIILLFSRRNAVQKKEVVQS